MATVDYEVTCRKCKNPHAYQEFHTRRLTKITSCDKCGLFHRLEPVTGESETAGGYGSYRIGFDGIAQSGSFKRRIRLRKRIAGLQRAINNPRVRSVEITVRVRGVWKPIVLKVKERRRHDFKFPRKAFGGRYSVGQAVLFSKMSSDIPF